MAQITKFVEKRTPVKKSDVGVSEAAAPSGPSAPLAQPEGATHAAQPIAVAPAATPAPAVPPAKPEASVQVAPVAVSTAAARIPETSSITRVPEAAKPLEIRETDALDAAQIEAIIRVARKAGLELAPPKQNYIRHTFSVTKERKEKMQAHSDLRGVTMQAAVCEAFDLYFAKYAAEFDRMKKAKEGAF